MVRGRRSLFEQHDQLLLIRDVEIQEPNLP